MSAVCVDAEGVERDALAYLLAGGNLGVPGGRYGSDTVSCAPVAIACFELQVESSGEATVELLDGCMSDVVNSSDSVLSLLVEHGSAAQLETVADAAWEFWAEGARELGRDAGRAAAAWVTDGNSSDVSRRRTLALLEDGDPAVEDFLPRMPDLSGEFADGPTPRSIAAEIVPAHYLEAQGDDIGYLETELSDAWEDGVADVFESECEANLRRALGLELALGDAHAQGLHAYRTDPACPECNS